MAYIKVMEQVELPANKMVMVNAGGKEVLLANVDGTYYALANKCTHFGGSLAKGVLEGSIVTCPKHGAQFDVRDGSAVTMPATEPTGSHAVRVDGDKIFVRLSV